MRENTRILTLPAGEEQMTFRLTKLDAFSGGRLLKLLYAAQEGQTSSGMSLSDFLFSLPDSVFESVMKVCLAHAEVQLPAGFIAVYRAGCWGLPALEYETLACLKLTLEVMAFSMEGFFPASASASAPGAGTSCR